MILFLLCVCDLSALDYAGLTRGCPVGAGSDALKNAYLAQMRASEVLGTMALELTLSPPPFPLSQINP